MKLAIMQPYFVPYIGYFQLIAAVDMFILYDNIKYTKKGWINRNRILRDGSDIVVTLPLKAGSDALDIIDRRLADEFRPSKLFGQFDGAYKAAPFYLQTMKVLEEICLFEDANLFRFNLNSIEKICTHLGIVTPIRASSTFPVDPKLRSQEKVLALCAAAGADVYVNPIGGVELYDRSEFSRRGVDLRFLRSSPFEYQQLGKPFVPWLSIIDVMMFNPPDIITELLNSGWEYKAFDV